MAVKTFSTGEVLTASDTNTYLANAGLVYVTSTAVGSGVSSVTVSNCFSSTYDNYKVIWSGGNFSAGNDGYLQLGSSTASYAYQIVYANFGAGAVSTYGDAAGANFRYVTEGDANVAGTNLELIGPNLAKYTACYSVGIGSGVAYMTLIGIHKVATAYTSFTVGPLAGTMSGGTITVYGYRKA